MTSKYCVNSSVDPKIAPTAAPATAPTAPATPATTLSAALWLNLSLQKPAKVDILFAIAFHRASRSTTPSSPMSTFCLDDSSVSELSLSVSLSSMDAGWRISVTAS